MPIEKVLQAVVVLRNEDRKARPVSRMCEPPVHLESASNGPKVLGKLGQVKVEIGGIELDASQKKIGFLVSVLIGEKNVAAVAEDEFRNRSDNTFAIWTGDKKNGGIMHMFRIARALPANRCALYG